VFEGVRHQFEPHQVRAVRFGSRWRGLDPDEVYVYLGLLADELDRLVRQSDAARTESERLREGLRQWRQRHIGCRFDDPPPASGDPEPGRQARNRGRW